MERDSGKHSLSPMSLTVADTARLLTSAGIGPLAK
jgi:hypothetical protein